MRKLISVIDDDYLRKNDLEFDDIPYIGLSGLELHIKAGDALKDMALNHLTKIVSHFQNCDSGQSASVWDLCGRQNQIMTDAAMLRQFVDSNNGRDIDDPLHEEYCSYLAVKRIDLYTNFRWTDSRIAFSVDIPDDGYEMAAKSSLEKTAGKDAVFYIESTAWAGIRVNHAEVFHKMRRMGTNPQKRLYYVLGKGFSSPWADLGARELRDAELGGRC